MITNQQSKDHGPEKIWLQARSMNKVLVNGNIYNNDNNAGGGDGHGNSLFVRLAPNTAVRLRDNCIQHRQQRQLKSSSLKCEKQHDSAWSLLAETRTTTTTTDGIEFLPLAITAPDNNNNSTTTMGVSSRFKHDGTTTTVYASYNGGDLSNENGMCSFCDLIDHDVCV